ncbi:CG8195 [Drosophila busckii]|uniref:Solute carrier family 35 member F5 n=1 Tax=Drosophila busckii TaxID=30019 RepID=A0A0M5J065_DROBS|nr:solute carrier family 35 member F5 [Drosophila busckii]XP_033148946.1 solute carrier family 35 member F5 [Drosophila busckii]ALC42011.1 CG8195 [Drosophila busckii]
MLGRTQKLLLGLTVLLLVNVLSVVFKQLTEFMFDEKAYNKPFLSTYFKTSMFSIYLLIIGLIAPWKESCERQHGNYTIMEQHADEENYYSNQAALSDPTFVPIRVANPINGVQSGTESDDSSVRSVRFSKLAEVREMSAHEATDALMARLSYAASMRIRRQKTHHKTAKTALLFCLLWFMANYFAEVALQMGDEAMVTLIRCAAAALFTLILAAVFPSSFGDKLTITKLLAVGISIAGIVFIAMQNLQDTQLTRGALLAVLSSFFYASYLVFVKRKSDTEEKVDIPLFFGFVGLWNLLLLWPILFILHFTRIESFELPSQGQFALLFLSGFLCTVLGVALWLWGCFLTSSLVGTLSLSLQIPLRIAIAALINDKEFNSIFCLGTLALILALLLVVLLLRNDESDPLMKLFKIVYRKICGCHKPNVVRVTDDEQQESLISSSD